MIDMFVSLKITNLHDWHVCAIKNHEFQLSKVWNIALYITYLLRDWGTASNVHSVSENTRKGFAGWRQRSRKTYLYTFI
jgi:hypothetical protein